MHLYHALQMHDTYLLNYSAPPCSKWLGSSDSEEQRW